MRRDDICIYVGPANQARLEAIIADRNSTSKAVWRARIVLATSDAHGTNAIMRLTGKSKPCVWRWQERYIAEGVDGLLRDKTRPSGKQPLSRKIRLKVLAKTANATPVNATHWSRASMAAEIGISPSSVGRIWAEAGLKPHLVRRFKISNDPQFEEKVTDVDVKSGIVICESHPRHRAKEFIRFLKRIDRCMRKHLDIHLVLDNYGTHKTPEVKAWLARHRRFKLHFTPTSASWLNLVERFFAEITTKRIRRGIFRSVAELEQAIHDYLERHNCDPKPFVWTKSAEIILEKERRALDLLEAIKIGNQPLDSEH